MALNISASAIRNPAPVIMLFIALISAGLMAFFQLPINQMPNVELPTLMVTTTRPGAAPAEMETQVAQRIESSLTGIDGVKRITTTISSGQAVTMVELWDGVDLSRAMDDARDAISRIRQDLPADILEPVIKRIDTAAFPVGYFAVESTKMSPQDLAWYVDNELARRLLAVRGVSAIERFGGSNREIRVELDPEKMRAFGATAADVNNQLRGVNVDAPGGRANIGGQAQSVRTLGEVQTAEQLRETRITLPNGLNVRLGDIALVRDGAGEPDALGRYGGKPVVAFDVKRSKSASALKVFDLVEVEMEKIGKERPDIKFITMASTVEQVRVIYESSLMTIVEGSILAVIVVFLVLRDWRATLISATAIPLSIIPTFFVMSMLGFTLNFLTLVGLGLVVGVLVDDAIVEVENIVRHMRMGKRPYRASLDAADEIGLAVVATSATLIAVFVPVAFMPGMTGQFFKSFGLTVAASVFFSLVVARLITPMMAAFLLKDGGHEDKPSNLRDRYMKALNWSLMRPLTTVGAGLAIFFVSLVAVIAVPFTFMPRTDEPMLQLNVEFSPGTTLRDGDRIMNNLWQEIDKKPYINNAYAIVFGQNGSADTANAFISLVPRSERTLKSFEIQQDLRPILSRTPNVRAQFVQDMGGGGGSSDITYDFVGADPKGVAAAADQLVQEMKKFPELADVKSSASLKRPELQIRPKPDTAARLGVSASAIAEAVRVATGGEIDQNTAKFSLVDRQIPIRVLLAQWARSDLETIKSLRVRSSTGEVVRLDAVADIGFGIGEASIERRDRERKVTVTANVIEGQPGTAQKKIEALPAFKDLPAGVSILPAGSTEDSADMIKNFLVAIITGLFLIYAVLVLLFHDFFQPITIMMVLPLSLGGAVIGLLVSQQPMSMMALIGILMLVGIVTKNSILLVDFAVEQMRAGMDRLTALREACSKRVRPIIMTTIAMSAGMMPLALGLGPDGALRQGMAAVVIGGLIIATALSLLFIPAVFVLVSRFESWMAPRVSKLSTYDPTLDAEGAPHGAAHAAAGHGDAKGHSVRPAAE